MRKMNTQKPTEKQIKAAADAIKNAYATYMDCTDQEAENGYEYYLAHVALTAALGVE